MKILHYRERFLPISETFIYQYLLSFTRSKISVLCHWRDNESLFPFPAEVQIRTADYPPDSLFRKIKTRVHRLQGNYAITKVHNNLRQALREIRPDLVHAHFGPEGTAISDACHKEGIPLVVSFYGYDISRNIREPRWVRAYERLFGQAAGVIALSEDFRRRLLALNCPAEKIHVVRVGVNPDEFAYRPPRPPGDSPIRLLGVARLVEKKGTIYALEAFAKLRRRANIRYTHLGDGPLMAEMEAAVKRLGLEDICSFPGAVSRAEVARAMAESDLFVLPSVIAANGDEEGIPGVLYEAMATGLPIAATRHSGIPEAVEEGGNGFLVAERDPEALAEALEKLIAMPDQWETFSRRGRQRIEEGFDVRTEAAKLEDIYAAILQRS